MKLGDLQKVVQQMIEVNGPEADLILTMHIESITAVIIEGDGIWVYTVEDDKVYINGRAVV